MPSASSMAAKVSRAAGNRSARSFPMPTFCAPCPGHISYGHHRMTVLPQVNPAPKATSSRSEPGLDPAFGDGLIERQRNGGGRGVAVAVHVDHHLLHGHAGVLGRGLDDPDVGLMGNQEIDLVRS